MYVIIDPTAADVIYTSFDNTVTSPAAQGSPDNPESFPNTFNSTDFVYSANLISTTVVELRVTNNCKKSDHATDLGPVYIKTIVRAFTVL